jgi:hypothetical protein
MEEWRKLVYAQAGQTMSKTIRIYVPLAPAGSILVDFVKHGHNFVLPVDPAGHTLAN